MRPFLSAIRVAFRRHFATVAIIMFTSTAAFQPQPVWAQTSGRPVNVNTADLATLETLPGVGPTVAQRIIDGRPYHSMSDLEKVKGLGKAKADALAGQITFDSTSAATKAKSTKGTPSASSAKPSTTANGRVNINTADATALETLPRVGPATAQKIIDWRTRNGRFRSIQDLRSVSGIGDATFAQLEPLVTV